MSLIFDGPYKDKSDEAKVAYLLLFVGERDREIYNTLNLSADDRKSVTRISDVFQHHLQPKSNPVFCRYKFNNERQRTSTIEEFVTKIKVLAQDCCFGDSYRDDMIRGRIVFGISSKTIRAKLIEQGDKLTHTKAIEICQSYEYAQSQFNQMKPESQTMVNALKTKRKSSHQHQASKSSIKCTATSGAK